MVTTLEDAAMDRIEAMIFGLVVLLAGTYSSARADAESWQMARLFEPTSAQLEAESRGRVVIYDGLTDSVVNRALDEQFDRVGTMMFIRTIVTDEAGKPKRDVETGQLLVENDGC
jgi:hypothetical protein